MADLHEPPQVSEWQGKVARFAGPVFIILGCIALVGSWVITAPTVEKINMVAGAMIFFGLYVIMLLVGVHREISRLRSQVDSLTKAHGESGSDSSAG